MDLLSGGRLDLGVGRGYQPIGVAAAEGHQPGKQGTFTWGARNNLRICVAGVSQQRAAAG